VADRRVNEPRKPKAAEVAARRISTRIVEEKLVEGTSLPHEAAMAEDLGVGRGTLREALRLLETQGIVRIRPGPGGGPVVRQSRPEDLVGAMSMVLQSLGAPLSHVADARGAVEAEVAARAALHAGPADVAQLQVTIDRMRAAPDDEAAFYAANKTFHDRLAELADNTVLLVMARTLAALTVSTDNAIRYSTRGRAQIADAHQRIVDAISAGDASLAHEEAAEHIREFRRYAEQHHPEALRSPVSWTPQS
jgi:GntR family transcriptional repressor for pyruvate dehydrogenase complex